MKEGSNKATVDPHQQAELESRRLLELHEKMMQVTKEKINNKKIE